MPQRRAALADWAAPVAGVMRRRCGGRLSILRDNIDNGGYRGRHNSARMSEPDGRSDSPVFALAMSFDFSCGKVRASRSAMISRSRSMKLTRVPISWFAPGGFMDYCWRQSVSFKEGVAAFNEKRVPKLRDDNSQPSDAERLRSRAASAFTASAVFLRDVASMVFQTKQTFHKRAANPESFLRKF